jgi:hypothetical protein
MWMDGAPMVAPFSSIPCPLNPKPRWWTLVAQDGFFLLGTFFFPQPPTPALVSHLPTYLPTYLHLDYLFMHLGLLPPSPTYVPTHVPTHLFTYSPIYLPSQ